MMILLVNKFGVTILQVETVVVVVTRPLPRDGGMAEDHEAPEAGKLTRVWTRGRRETESPKNERHIESVAGQCRMR